MTGLHIIQNYSLANVSYIISVNFVRVSLLIRKLERSITEFAHEAKVIAAI